MAAETTPAEVVGDPGRLDAIGGRFQDFHGAGESQLALDPLDGGKDALTRNGALDEDHLAVVTADHPAAGGRLLDGQFQSLSRFQRHG